MKLWSKQISYHLYWCSTTTYEVLLFNFSRCDCINLHSLFLAIKVNKFTFSKKNIYNDLLRTKFASSSTCRHPRPLVDNIFTKKMLIAHLLVYTNYDSNQFGFRSHSVLGPNHHFNSSTTCGYPSPAVYNIFTKKQLITHLLTYPIYDFNQFEARIL